jgi:Outer membrane lipoprotein-sorting protein
MVKIKEFINMKKFILLSIFLMGVSQLWAITGQEIMDNSIEVQETQSAAMDIQMDLIDDRGSVSTRRLQILSMQDNTEQNRTIAVFMSPASIKNTRFLTIENSNRSDDQWIYLPTMRKTKRIASSDRESSFMGTDFTYGDMSDMQVDTDRHTLVREEMFNNRSCYVVESIPLNPVSASRSKLISWIDKEWFLPLKVEFYNKRSKELDRTAVSENITQVDGIWTPLKVTMTTHKTEHKTILTIIKAKYNIPMNPGYFTTNFLSTGRVNK